MAQIRVNFVGGLVVGFEIGRLERRVEAIEVKTEGTFGFFAVFHLYFSLKIVFFVVDGLKLGVGMPDGSISHFADFDLFIVEFMVGRRAIDGNSEQQFGFLDFVVGDS